MKPKMNPVEAGLLKRVFAATWEEMRGVSEQATALKEARNLAGDPFSAAPLSQEAQILGKPGSGLYPLAAKALKVPDSVLKGAHREQAKSWEELKAALLEFGVDQSKAAEVIASAQGKGLSPGTLQSAAAMIRLDEALEQGRNPKSLSKGARLEEKLLSSIARNRASELQDALNEVSSRMPVDQALNLDRTVKEVTEGIVQDTIQCAGGSFDRCWWVNGDAKGLKNLKEKEAKERLAALEEAPEICRKLGPVKYGQYSVDFNNGTIRAASGEELARAKATGVGGRAGSTSGAGGRTSTSIAETTPTTQGIKPEIGVGATGSAGTVETPSGAARQAGASSEEAKGVPLEEGEASKGASNVEAPLGSGTRTGGEALAPRIPGTASLPPGTRGRTPGGTPGVPGGGAAGEGSPAGRAGGGSPSAVPPQAGQAGKAAMPSAGGADAPSAGETGKARGAPPAPLGGVSGGLSEGKGPPPFSEDHPATDLSMKIGHDEVPGAKQAAQKSPSKAGAPEALAAALGNDLFRLYSQKNHPGFFQLIDPSFEAGELDLKKFELRAAADWKLPWIKFKHHAGQVKREENRIKVVENWERTMKLLSKQVWDSGRQSVTLIFSDGRLVGMEGSLPFPISGEKGDFSIRHGTIDGKPVTKPRRVEKGALPSAGKRP